MGALLSDGSEKGLRGHAPERVLQAMDCPYR
jgi:hypothetical protein